MEDWKGFVLTLDNAFRPKEQVKKSLLHFGTISTLILIYAHFKVKNNDFGKF